MPATDPAKPATSSPASQSSLHDLQVDILLALANDEDPKVVADRLCTYAERMSRGRLASIMLVGADDHLNFFSAPSAPEVLLADLDHLKPGPHSGSCGNVLHRREPTFVAHVREDERWRDLHAIARKWEIGSCWSYPIWRRDQLLGTFALTGPEERLPDQDEEALLENLATIASVIVVYAQNARERAQVHFLSKFAQRTANAIVRLNRDLEIIWANPAFETISGQDRTHLIGQSLDRLQAPQTDRQVLHELQTAQTAGNTFTGELQLQRLGGGTFWVNVDSAPLMNDQGEVDGHIVLFTDITERLDEMARLERAKHFYNMLAETNQQISEARDERELFTAACDIAVNLGGMQVAWIGRPNESGNFKLLATTATQAEMIEQLKQLTLSVDPNIPEGQGISGQAFRDQHPYFSQRIAEDTRLNPWRQEANRFQLNAMAALPLFNRGKITAVFCVYHHETDIFDEELVDLLNELAQDITRGLDRLDLQHEAEEATANLERQQALLQSLLAQIDTLINADQEQALLEVACTRLIESGLFLAAWIGEPDDEGEIHFLAASGDAMDTLNHHPLPRMSDGNELTLDEAMRTQAITVESRPESPLIAPWMSFAIPGWQPAALVVPVQRQDAPWAVLVAVAQNLDDIDRSMTDILGRLGELLTQGLAQLDLRNHLAEEQAQSAYLADHDALTGLANRRALERTLPLAMARARRDGRLLAVALIDLDDFKPVNDRYGHGAGDLLLKQLAERFRHAMRETDLVARLGGDEFVLLLEGLDDINDLEHVLERVNEAARPAFELNHGISARIGLSIGITLYPKDSAEPDQLIRHADAALYICKSTKANREHNWSLWHESTAEELAKPPSVRLDDDPYGAGARKLLTQIRHNIKQLAHYFVDRFYEEIAKDAEAARVVGYLDEEELAHLKQRQADHLSLLLSPELTEERHRVESNRVGEIHGLIGLANSSLVRSITIYFQQLGQVLDRQPLSIRDQAALERIITSRLGNELGFELEAEQLLNTGYQQSLIDLEQLWRTNTQWTDFNQELLDTLVKLPGIVGASISAPGADGAFVVNQSRGMNPYVQYMRDQYGIQRMPHLNPSRPESEGPTSLAYRYCRLQTVASTNQDPRVAPWREAARHAGIRSAAAMPITDQRDQPIAVLSLYGAYPGMFESQIRQTFCNQIAKLISAGWRRMETPNLNQVSTEELERWRQAFYAQGLIMYFQPIIDAQTGQTIKFEALARLLLADGTIVAPGQFIPWLGQHELIRLFRHGLDQALEQLKQWTTTPGQPLLKIGLNLPPEVLAHKHCADWVAEALQRHGVAPGRLTLEVLEDQEIQDPIGTMEQLQRLDRLGVELAMDDLGSGYSSLLRLRTLPFHIVKIDQGLARSAHLDPERVITFMGSLIQLANSLGLSVVVEGVETQDLIEASAILGANMSQGYGIARPMSAQNVPNWLNTNQFAISLQQPVTALGAMAVHWRLEYATETLLANYDTQPDDSPHGIEAFILHNGLQGSVLDDTHRQMQEVKRREGRNSPAYRYLVGQVTTLLAGYIEKAA